MSLAKTSNNMKGMAGEYFVCAELCKENILALLTPKNNPLFDVVASDPNGGKSISIQVKTMGVGNSQGWRLGKDITTKRNNPNLYVVLVNLKDSKPNDYYVFYYDELVDIVNNVYANYITILKKDGSKRKEVDFRWVDIKHLEEFKHRRNSWNLITQALSDEIPQG